MILTEATLAEIHNELAERLKLAHGKPLMITVTHIDETKDNRFQYFMCTNNEFSHEDIYKTLCYLGKQAIENNNEPSKNLKIVENVKEQLQVRTKAALRG